MIVLCEGGSEMKGEYGQSSQGNFKVIDTIGVPHAYMITEKHVGYASDRGGILSESVIEAAERQGAKCGQRGCTLDFKGHEQALLVECKMELKDDAGIANLELHQYLLAIKEETEKSGYAGFAFKKAF